MARWRRIEPPRGTRLVVALLVLAALAPAAAETGESERPRLRFALHGERVASLDLAALRRAAEVHSVRVFEPYEQREAVFRALPFAEVLDAVYGRAWRDEPELLFTCRDGYQPALPVQRVLDHAAWLAFERSDQEAFSIAKRESGRVQQIDLGPFYLVWENREDPVVRREGDYGWPYQLVGIDVIDPAERFPKLAPPEGAHAEVREGFLAFRRFCSRCHAVQGEGGKVGPELVAGGGIVAARDPARLRRWIDDPSQLVPNARMPALDPQLPEREATIDALVAYLRAMAREAQRAAGPAEAR